MRRPRNTGLVALVLPLGMVSTIVVGACSLLLDTEGLGSPATTDSGGSNESNVDAGSALDADADAPATTFDLGCNAPQLVAAWTFDEGKGTVASDCTGHGFEATLAGDAGWVVGRDGGSALSLPGSAWAEIAKPAELRFAGPISVAAWVVLTSLDFNGRIFASSAFEIDPGIELTFEKGPRSTEDQRVSYWSSIIANANNDVLTSADGLGNKSAFVWTHLVGTYDGATSSIFVDGNLEGTAQVPTRRLANQPFYIGRRSDCCSFRGHIDDLRIYSRALGADEVRALAGR